MKEFFIAKQSDFIEVTDFINSVFDCKFPEFMEKVYTKQNFSKAIHLCIRDEGKIAACVAIYPQKIQYDASSIECAWIGSVSVAEDKRGLGYMKELMAEADKEIIKRGIPFAYLSGKRNRYAFYGYEITGIRNFFSFDEENIRHSIGFDKCEGYEFVPVYNGDKEELDNILSLYSKREIKVRTSEDMIEGMRTWGYRPYAIKKDSEFLGYVVMKDRDIAEIELKDSSKFINVFGALIKKSGYESINVESREWEREKCRLFAEICERYRIETLGNMKIFDYLRTYKFFMEFERKFRRLKCGRVTIHVQMCCTFFIKVDEEGIKTGNADHEEADLFLTSAQLIRLTFTKGSSFITDNNNELVRNWFPLSYTPERVDEF